MSGSGTHDDPWRLKTAPGTSEYTMYRDEQADPPALVCEVGSTTLRYHLSAIDDLHAMLAADGGWVELGAADEKKDPKPDTVEAWGRSLTTRWAGGTACARDTVGDSGCTCHRCWRSSASSNSNTTPATTECALSDHRPGTRAPSYRM